MMNEPDIAFDAYRQIMDYVEQSGADKRERTGEKTLEKEELDCYDHLISDCHEGMPRLRDS